MYVYLMDDICSLEYDNDDLSNISAIENIINTAYEGGNIIDADIKTFRFLKESNILSANYLKKLLQIIDFNREYGSLYSTIPHKIYVSGLSNTFTKDGENWVIPLKSISYGKYAHLELLAEDEDDAKLLIFAINHFQNLNQDLRSFNIKVKPTSGGGSRIRSVLETKLKDRENFLVCFCDTDKLSGLSTLGNITQSCKEFIENEDFPSVFSHTCGREMENDLPHYFIDETLEILKNPQPKQTFTKLKVIYSQIDLSVYKYTDIKEGMTVKDIRNISCMHARKFWKESVDKLKENEFLPLDFDLSKENENSIVVEHVSKSMATNVLSWLNFEYDTKPRRVHETIKDCPDAQGWLEHGKNLFWLGAGMKKGRL